MDTPAISSRIRRSLGLVLGCLLSCSPSASAQELWDTQFHTDGSVYVAHEIDGILYVGGYFKEVGRPVGPLVPIDPVTGSIPTIFPRVSGGAVYSIVPDGFGGFYLGGAFTEVGGFPRANLAHVDASLAVTAWNPGTNDVVVAMDLEGAILYVGGRFTEAGGLARNRLAAIDAQTGAATPWNPGADELVNAIDATSTLVYAGGRFTNIGGASRFKLAALSPSTGIATAFDAQLVGGFYGVEEVVAGGTSLYFAGEFTEVGGRDRAGLAAVDATTGTPTAWDPAPNGIVNALAYHGSSVYVGGGFSTIGTKNRLNLAEISVSNGRATNWAPEIDGGVLTLRREGTEVVVGGFFFEAGGEPRQRIAAFDATSGSVTAWAPSVGLTPDFGYVFAVARSGNHRFAGGTFQTADRQERKHLFAIDLATRQTTAWAPAPDSTVRDLAGHAATPLYVSGDFGQVGGAARSRLAALDRVSGLATSWNPSPDSHVSALEVEGTTLYVGGWFGSIAGQPRSRLAAFDTGTGSLTAWAPSANGIVHSIAPAGPTVWIGGAFHQVNGVARDQVAAIDAASGDVGAWTTQAPVGPIDPETFESAPAAVSALAVDGNTLYVGGRFRSIGGRSVSNLAALDITTGLADPWTPGGPGSGVSIYDQVSDLLVRGDEIVVAGNFSMMGGVSRIDLGAVDRTSGAATTWNPDGDPWPNASVMGLVELGPHGFGAYSFSQASGGLLRGLALFTNPTGPVDVPGSGLPSSIALHVPHPHPLVDRGHVRFTLRHPGPVRLTLVDVAGRTMRTLIEDEPRPAGENVVAFDRDGLAAGVYFLRLAADGESIGRKLVVTP